jgi:hypothetical protein
MWGIGLADYEGDRSTLETTVLGRKTPTLNKDGVDVNVSWQT